MSRKERIEQYFNDITQEEKDNIISKIKELNDNPKMKMNTTTLKSYYELYNTIYDQNQKGYYCGTCRRNIREKLLKVLEYIN